MDNIAEREEEMWEEEEEEDEEIERGEYEKGNSELEDVRTDLSSEDSNSIPAFSNLPKSELPMELWNKLSLLFDEQFYISILIV
jgi:hypothetical protein